MTALDARTAAAPMPSPLRARPHQGGGAPEPCELAAWGVGRDERRDPALFGRGGLLRRSRRAPVPHVWATQPGGNEFGTLRSPARRRDGFALSRPTQHSRSSPRRPLPMSGTDARIWSAPIRGRAPVVAHGLRVLDREAVIAASRHAQRAERLESPGSGAPPSQNRRRQRRGLPADPGCPRRSVTTFECPIPRFEHAWRLRRPRPINRSPLISPDSDSSTPTGLQH